MILDSIKLINFRNYEKLEAKFFKGINLLYGNNATGKTSLVEAIYYLSLARSFRTSVDQELINTKKEFSSIFGKITLGKSIKEIEIYLAKDGKRIILNKKPIKKISDLSQIINCLYFIPKDVTLLKDAPKNRRLFLNLNISKISNKYLQLISNYERLLKERNDQLKKNIVDQALIEVLTNQLISNSKEIYLYRKDYISELNKAYQRIYQELNNSNDLVKIIYLPFISNTEHYIELAEIEYKNSYELDLKRKQTNKGIHKEDFYISINGKNIGVYGSQGENRLAVLALKLTPYELINDFKLKPIVILDDVLSELDIKHREKLIAYLSNLTQVFITSTEKIDINNANYLYINSDNKVKGE